MSGTTEKVIGAAIVAVVLVIFVLAVFGMAIRIERDRRTQFEREAIQHGAGTYDRETGKFIWKEKP